MIDDIHITDSEMVVEGLMAMVESALGPHELVHRWMPIERALLLVELIGRAPDHEEWFPRGRWATRQAIQAKIDKALNEISWEEPLQ